MRRRPWLALLPLLGGTLLGTVSSGIVTVPLRDIATDLEATLQQAILVLVAFLLTFAVSMPFAGWLGDRAGRRRVYCAALAVLAAGALGAAIAPNLAVLVGFRAVQGVATGAIVPAVMGLIATMFEPSQRGRALGAWAAANGVGQAVAPVAGGLLAGALSWRWIFVPVAPIALLLLAATLRLVPRDHGQRLPLEWVGALTLTGGTALVIAAAASLAQPGRAGSLAPALASAGLVSLILFVVLAGRIDQPFVSPDLLKEPSYVRSSVAVLAQMFCLGATLAGVPLYLIGQAGLSTAAAGVAVLALPVAMAVIAPLSGLITDRVGPRPVIRSGLLVLVVAQLFLAVELSGGTRSRGEVVLALALAGTGVALIQAPAALGATRSPAGRVGASIGLFNLIRFTGSAVGAAWVAIALNASEPFGAMFGVCAVVAAAGCAGTFTPTRATGRDGVTP